MPRFCLFVCCFLGYFSLHSQTNLEIDFQDASFFEMVDSLEKQTQFHFFYQDEWVDDLKITTKGTYNDFPSLLSDVLSDTDLHYFITETGDVIISKQYKIVHELSPEFWKEKGEEIIGLTTNEIFIEKGGSEETVSIGNEQVYEIGGRTSNGKSTVSLAGYIRTARTGEPLVGASVFVKASQIGTLTDDFGYYVLNLPPGEYKVEFQYIGLEDTYRNILLNGDGRLDVEIEDEVLALDEVVITGEKSQLESVQTGAARLSINEIKTVPTLLGEADVLKISLNLPGVQTVGEGASGFNVRGGGTDQNLIMLNGAPVYNPNHLFGFFSAFNPVVIKHADLFKSGIQAQYGGRVSSVLDISIRDGNKKKFIGTAGIGPVTSKLVLEGPLSKNKGSYIIGLRSTYANWLFKALKNPSLNNSRAFFGDGIAKLNYQLNDHDFLTLSLYHSQDRFQLNGDSLYTYANSNMSLSWRHAFNNKFSLKASTGITHYQYGLQSEQNLGNAFQLGYQINQGFLNLDFDLFPTAQHHVKFGWQTNYYDLNPGKLLPLADSSFVQPIILDSEQGVETALYLGDEWTISPRLSIYAGLRFSGYAMIGPGKSFLYQEGLPKETDFIIDTLNFTSDETIAQYGGLDYRFSGRFKISENLSTKFSYDKTRQYIHMLSNTIAISPTDTWRLSNAYLRPQIGDQIAVGMYKEIPQSGYEVSVEAYYKKLNNILEYKDGANLLVNETLEADVLSAEGKSYGIELLLKKKTGQLNGWIAYTYSRTFIKANSPFKSERINGGEFYPANYDIPHNLSIITNYKVTRRFNFSVNLSYRTGRPTTLPVLQYQLRNNVLAFFSARNKFRVPDYFRMDLAVNLDGDHRVEKRGHSSWSFSLYNFTARKNAYSVFTRNNEGNIGVYRLAVLGTVIPTITFNYELR